MNTKTGFKNLLVIFLLAMTVFSCREEENVAQSQPEISYEEAVAIAKMNFDGNDARKELVTNPFTNETELNYVLEGDIYVPESQFLEMMNAAEQPQTEQYRTTNLVSVPGSSRTISVLGYDAGSSSSYSLDSKMKTALQMAVANYNSESLKLNFTLSYGTNTGAADIVVYRVTGGAGGSAGFPSGGNPYKWAQIFSGTSTYSTDVVEHVITHEIGHCLGFRHTDYFNRSISCGSGGNEGAGSDGAIHIPGTPATSGIDMNSIMLACFNSSQSGEFSNHDVTALEYMYGIPQTPTTYLNVSPTYMGFDSYWSSKNVTVSSNTTWTVTEYADWIMTGALGGNGNGSFSIIVSQNYNCYSRSAYVTVNGGSAGNKTIYVTQAPSNNGYPCY